MKTKLRIRNSMLSDWDNMCQLAFKARWFGTDEDKEKMDIGYKQSIRWGLFFEQLIFGSGMGGKTIELTEKEYGSVHYKRIKAQASEAREYLFKHLGVPFVASQVQLFAEIEVDGMIIPVEGNIDGAFGHDRKIDLIVDTKYTADTSNEYGNYSWGRPEDMDMGQLVMYKTLVLLNYGTLPEAMYYVADSTTEERVEVIRPDFSPSYVDWYNSRIKDAYIGINQAINFDHWVPKNGYNECKKCPFRDTCPSAIKQPTIKIIEK